MLIIFCTFTMYTTTVNYLLYLKRNRVSGYILVHTPSFIKDETEYLTCFQMCLPVRPTLPAMNSFKGDSKGQTGQFVNHYNDHHHLIGEKEQSKIFGNRKSQKPNMCICLL